MNPQTITPHEFNVAADAFHDHPEDSAYNDQGNRREKLRAALEAIGVTIDDGFGSIVPLAVHLVPSSFVEE